MKIGLVYGLLLSTITMGLLSSEPYAMTMHVKNIDYNSEFILCTSSGNDGVDCGVFGIKNYKPLLICSTYIANKDITNFTDTIGALLSFCKNQYVMNIRYACFAGPGVPSEDLDYLTHIRLPYTINAKEIRAANGLDEAFIVNDFLAMSYGIDFLDATKIATLYDAPPAVHGTRIIIGAGHGLGSVSMIWNKEQQIYNSYPAEAGTGDFPAHSQFEFDLAMKMKHMRNMSTVHWANFVSLSGIEYTYQMLDPHAKKMDGLDILTHAADDLSCQKAAELFFSFYARFVYNVVWTTLPFGGIYLVRGTATDYPEMLNSIFLPEYFNCVASKRPLLERIPVYIIKDDVYTELYGTASYFVKEKRDLFEQSLLKQLRNKLDDIVRYIQG